MLPFHVIFKHRVQVYHPWRPGPFALLGLLGSGKVWPRLAMINGHVKTSLFFDDWCLAKRSINIVAPRQVKRLLLLRVKMSELSRDGGNILVFEDDLFLRGGNRKDAIH